MFISYNWLRELTGTRLNPEEIRDRLTNVGLAVDAVEARGDDFVIDVEVPSNRGDCLSHLGIARELAVIEKSKVQSLTSKVENPEGKTGEFTSVEIRDPDLCPRYSARIVRSVRIGPSPGWLTKKLEAIGQRPINNVADITNYVLHEFGQPLHAFDLARLAENRIVVRRATGGEMLKTLDGVERKLDPEMLVIADAKRAVAVGGVMGGEESEISNSTTDVLIESAFFNPASVRRTAKLLGLHTEASHRFERGTNPEGVLPALNHCVALICEIAGGVATEDAIDVYPNPTKTRSVNLRPERIEAITSLRVEENETKRILAALGFNLRVEHDTALTFDVPAWRHDVAIEEDLVEEVARHSGYDNINTALPPASFAGEYHSSEKRKRALRSALKADGFNEAINLSFIELTNDFEPIPAFANQSELVTLTNPIIEEASRMRQTLLPGLLNAVRHNMNHGIRDICLFETGRVFTGSAGESELPDEREALALVATGGILEADRAQATRDLDFFDLKGALEAAVEAMNLPSPNFEAATVKHLRLGQAAAIHANGTLVGWIGTLAEVVSANYKFRQPVFVAELDLTTLLEMNEQPVLYSPLPRFPSIVRDVSLLVDRENSVSQLMAAAKEQGGTHFVAAYFVGTYEGEGIPDYKRSVTLRFEYRAPDRTLRDEEIDGVHWSIVKVLQEKFSAEVR
ncbi:MAG TPA: phenylalanine--tRNA ligase subunit beta [Pyrinomonadaceae bacterium]|nr:phenylalanine--tRNA ligase subunit beta [Pyrinomonadaceae bacterium]